MRSGRRGQAPLLVEEEIAAPGIADGTHGGGEQQQRIHARVVPGAAPASEGWAARPPARTNWSCAAGTASWPSSGSAFLMPPPVSSSAPRSSEMTIRGAVRRGEMRFDEVGEVVDVDDRASPRRLPASPSRQWSISARPPTLTSGFGVVAETRPHALADAGRQHHRRLRHAHPNSPRPLRYRAHTRAVCRTEPDGRACGGAAPSGARGGG